MNTPKLPVKVAIVDDHVLVRHSIVSMIESFGGFDVIHHSSNGKELMQAIREKELPEVILLDLCMPEMDGFETAMWLNTTHPEVVVLMLSSHDSELNQIRLLKCGVKGFIKKDCLPAELRLAMQSVAELGYYYSNRTANKIANIFRSSDGGQQTLQKAMLSDQEIQFMKLICSELTYKAIAMQMKLNPRSIDTLRDQLFVKLDVKSRVGLVMLAIQHGIVTLQPKSFENF